MKNILDSMLANASFSVLFQPIFDVTTDDFELWAREALTRGPRGTHFETASVLFDYVRLKRDEIRVDRHCCANALAAASRLDDAHVISVNAHASTLERDRGFASFFLDSCREAGVSPEKMVIEIVEHVPYVNTARLSATLAELREAGVQLAVDDLGFGHGNLRMFLDVRPQYVKVERYFVHGCATDPDRRLLLRAIYRLACDFGALMIAEGVERSDDLDVVREIGIPLAQGYLLGQPAIQFGEATDKEPRCNARRSSV